MEGWDWIYPHHHHEINPRNSVYTLSPQNHITIISKEHHTSLHLHYIHTTWTSLLSPTSSYQHHHTTIKAKVTSLAPSTLTSPTINKIPITVATTIITIIIFTSPLHLSPTLLHSLHLHLSPSTSRTVGEKNQHCLLVHFTTYLITNPAPLHHQTPRPPMHYSYHNYFIYFTTVLYAS